MFKGKEMWHRGYEGWHLHREYFGEAEYVEADFCIHCDNFYVGLGLNIGFSGSYQLRVTDRLYESNGRYGLALIKRVGSLRMLDSILFEETEVHLEKEQWFHLKLEFREGILLAYVDGELLLQYDDTPSKYKHLEGEVGVWLQPESGGTEARNFIAKGNWRETDKEVAEEIEETGYHIDFASCKLGETPYGWTHMPYDNNWVIVSDDNSKSFQSDVTATNAITWLHVFENNPKIRLHMNASETTRGRFGVIFRYAPETAYVKIGYDFLRQSWFVEDTPALHDRKTTITYAPQQLYDWEEIHQIEINAKESQVALYVDGELAVSTEVGQTGYGKIGLFSEEVRAEVFDFDVQLPSGGTVIPEVYVHTVAGDEFAGSMELEETDDGLLIGVKKAGVYCSEDEGLSFHKAGAEYDGMETKGAYQSILKLRNGTYLQVLLAKEMEVQVSKDLMNWETVGRVMPIEEQYVNGMYNVMFHVSSLAEVLLPNGNTRIFLPVAYSTGELDKKGYLFRKCGHDAWVYYSDDEGRTWQRSENTIYDLTVLTDEDPLPEWAEAKIVPCADGSIRLYASRTRSQYMCYTESTDYGKTWGEIHEMTQMPCPLSSFAVCEDPFERGTYYLCWVNTKQWFFGAGMPRTRLSLARSRNGKDWEYLCDIERNGTQFSEIKNFARISLFQILDPCILVTEKYVYISFGCSVRGAGKTKLGTIKAVHHEQRVKVARIKKEYLKETIDYE